VEVSVLRGHPRWLEIINIYHYIPLFPLTTHGAIDVLLYLMAGPGSTWLLANEPKIHVRQYPPTYPINNAVY